MLEDLDPAERLQLMKFVCAVAWSDLRVTGEERRFVGECIRRLALTDAERQQVWQWLEVPPQPEEVDPQEIRRDHRRLFMDAIERVVAADARVTPQERETLALLRELMR
jgi:hypothetical protein